MENAPTAPYRIAVSADAGQWRWSVANDRQVASGQAPTRLTAGGSARVAAGVLSGLGRIAQRRF